MRREVVCHFPSIKLLCRGSTTSDLHHGTDVSHSPLPYIPINTLCVQRSRFAVPLNNFVVHMRREVVCHFPSIRLLCECLRLRTPTTGPTSPTLRYLTSRLIRCVYNEVVSLYYSRTSFSIWERFATFAIWEGFATWFATFRQSDYCVRVLRLRTPTTGPTSPTLRYLTSRLIRCVYNEVVSLYYSRTSFSISDYYVGVLRLRTTTTGPTSPTLHYLTSQTIRCMYNEVASLYYSRTLLSIWEGKWFATFRQSDYYVRVLRLRTPTTGSTSPTLRYLTSRLIRCVYNEVASLYYSRTSLYHMRRELVCYFRLLTFAVPRIAWRSDFTVHKTSLSEIQRTVGPAECRARHHSAGPDQNSLHRTGSTAA